MERTYSDWMFEIEYAMRLCLRHRRFFGRMRITFLCIKLFGTTAAVSALLAKNPEWAVIGGLALSLVGILDQVIDPSRRRAAFVQDYKRYAAVKRAAAGKTASDVAKLVAKAREDDADEIESLRNVAFNDTVRQEGRDETYAVRLNALETLFRALA